MSQKINLSDIITLKDGRKAIVHAKYDNGRAYLVEIINALPQKSELPIINYRDINFHCSPVTNP